jgi:hypothetical protein
MWAPLIIVKEPGVQVILQLLDGTVDLFAECHTVELVEDGAMEALTNSVRLWALGLGAAVVDVLDREIELVSAAFAGNSLVFKEIAGTR